MIARVNSTYVAPTASEWKAYYPGIDAGSSKIKLDVRSDKNATRQRLFRCLFVQEAVLTCQDLITNTNMKLLSVRILKRIYRESIAWELHLKKFQY